MAWIEVHQSLPTHKKTLALADALQIEPAQAMGHMVALWLWAIDNAPDGDLTEVSAATVARVCLWPKRNHQRFLDALILCGLVDNNDGLRIIHDYDEYIGKLVARRGANKERMQRARAQHVQSTGAQHVRNTNAARAPATVHNTTVPYTTLPGSAGASPSRVREILPQGLPAEVASRLARPPIDLHSENGGAS